MKILLLNLTMRRNDVNYTNRFDFVECINKQADIFDKNELFSF